jgi:hypothetical protein
MDAKPRGAGLRLPLSLLDAMAKTPPVTAPPFGRKPGPARVSAGAHAA